MTIEQRIEALERRCKRLSKTLVGVGTLALFAVVAGTAGWTVAYTGHISPRSITTKSIVLKDQAGKRRVVLDGATTPIKIYDRNGSLRIALRDIPTSGGHGHITTYRGDQPPGEYPRPSFSISGSNLRTFDTFGRLRLEVNGRAGPGTLKVYDRSRKQRIFLDGVKGKIRVNGSTGRKGIMLDASSNIGKVSVHDGRGFSRIKLDGRGEVALYDRAIHPMIHLSPSNSSVTIRDSARKTRIWLNGSRGEISTHDSTGRARTRLYGNGSIGFFRAEGTRSISHP